MHAPDGLLEPSVAIATAIFSVTMVALALRRARTELGDRQIPLAGLAAAFIFAAQMVNFPVASGTSGHLLGGALAAILLGPWVGSLVVTIVVIVQALIFADGGLSALGYNILNMAIVPAFAGWALYHLVRRLLSRNRAGIIAATGIAAGASVVLSSVAFSIEWLFGASAPVPFDDVFGAMVGVHTLIGIGEGLISAAAVGAVLAARPDLVAGARGLNINTAGQPMGVRPFVVAGAVVSLAIAAVIAQFASGSPDGLERVADQKGFASTAEHSLTNSIFADYATAGIDNEVVSLAIAGIAGTLVVLLVGIGAFGLASSRRSPAAR
ncbi:MAG: cobalt ABC transporter permease [Ilumatobacter coccineus]|uniref:Cobalt ABC transporter permease n=1 Tax=Ilumatobacter coccineus TaxID=467094 RepID=A0A2G6KAU0_9ACTN|nr:MAG: cobalt ABC transporter permease [Ilumatobacter coccineus]